MVGLHRSFSASALVFLALSGCGTCIPADDPDEIDEREADGQIPREIAPWQCGNDDDCIPYPERPYCHPEVLDCTECIIDEHCPYLHACNPYGVCIGYIGCNTDADCPQGTPRCDPEKGWCTECLDHSDCTPEEYCREDFQNECVPDVCMPGEMTCVGNEVVECNDFGDRWNLIDECNEDEECVGDHCEEIDDNPTDEWPPPDGTEPPDATEPPDTTQPESPGGDFPEDPTGGDATGDSTENTRSCACRTERPQAPAWLLFAGAFLRRRRRG